MRAYLVALTLVMLYAWAIGTTNSKLEVVFYCAVAWAFGWAYNH